ncbi:STAS/SEC14 domain-containing protein [candidate division WOR-3 bacterium]|nr:STAS/SEC14 domain-containing protein [candidate division WOR-3 bacterium]
MKYEIRLDKEHGLLRLIIFESIDKENVDEMMPAMARELDTMTRRLVLVDMSNDKNSTSMTKRARKAYKEHAAAINTDKVAMVGASPITRMFAKIALGVMGKSEQTRFFKTEEDALAWLKGDYKDVESG